MAHLSPPLGRACAPPFFQLPWQDFQLMCRELLSRENGIGVCNEYGINGQSQFGADLLAEYESTGDHDVAQCKCWREVDADGIRDAGAEFRKHRKHWLKPRTRRFILMIACDVSDQHVQAAIRAAKLKLSKVGMRLLVWGARQIEDKLRIHRDIVARYCGDVWVDHICGRRSGIATAAVAEGTAIIVAQMGEFAAELSDAKAKDLDRLIELSKQHRFADALDGVRELKGTRTWPALKASLRSRVLRFEATTVINLKNNLPLAAQLIAEARNLDVAGDFQVADAYYAYRAGDRERALEILATPKTLNAFNLRLGLTLEAAGPQAMLAAAAQPGEGIQPDAETHRYVALAHLFDDNHAAAVTAIDFALKTGSKQPPVRETYAQVLYFSAISHAFSHAFRHLQWPIPVPWVFVKRGRVELDNLKRAADIFATLAREAPRRDEEAERYCRWQVGALGCHAEEQAAAAEAARKRLNAEPDDAAVVVWSLERGYDFDRGRSVAALEKRLKAGGNVEDCMALITLFVFNDELSRADALLDAEKARFNGLGGNELWQRQKDEIAKLVAALQKGDRAIDNAVRSRELEERYRADADDRTLFELCEVKLHLKEWDYVADRAAQLLQAIGTEAALRLAVFGLFQAGRYAPCLETLERHLHLLPDGSLSMDLVELRIECRRRLGHVSKAVDEAEKAFQSNRTFRQLLHLFQTQLAASDIPGAVHSARIALKLYDSPAGFLIEAARLVTAFDRPLAIELWRRGVAKGITAPRYVQLAYEAAMGLGLDREAAPLGAKLFALAREGKAGLVAVDLLQARQNLRDQSRAAADVMQTYSRGQTIAHVVAATTRVSLGQLYHTFLRTNHAQDAQHRTFPVFLRAASRSVAESKKFKVPTGPLRADISALLVAQELDLLDAVESAFGPVQLSQHISEALLREVTEVSGMQVSRSVCAGKFLTLADAKRLVGSPPAATVNQRADLAAVMGAEWVARLTRAQEENGAIVDYLPLRSNDDELRLVELNPDNSRRVLGTVDLARLLFLGGRLSAADYESKRTLLPENLSPKPDEILRPILGRPIHLVGNIWETLADADLLEALCAVCTVSVEADEIEQARRLKTQAANVQALTAALARLGQRVRDGLSAGRYTLLPAGLAKEQLNAETPAVRALRDVMDASDGGTGWIWCDDRMLSRQRLSGKRPLVGIFEILCTLRERGAISDLQYFEKLQWLRTANARYLPVLAEEISYQLTQAAVQDDAVVETPALATLRRYVASCLLDRERLHPPQVDGTSVRGLHDFTFLFELRQEVHAALREVWLACDASAETRIARANWIWTALYFDVSSFHQLATDSAGDPNVVENTVMAIGALFVEGLMVKRERNQPTSPRQLYFRWLRSQIVEPFLQANESTKVALARDVGKHIRSAMKERVAKEIKLAPRLLNILLQEYINDLPEDFALELGLTSAELDKLGIIVSGPTISVEQYKMNAEEFWRAIEMALVGGTGEVIAREPKRRLLFSRPPQATGPFVVQLTDESTGELHLLNDPIHPVYAPDEPSRLAGIRRLSRWFDRDAAERDREMLRIANFQPSSQRGILLAAIRAESTELFYRDLHSSVANSESFNLEDLFPDRWDGMFRHLRLSPETTTPDFADMVERWRKDDGLEAALERASCLPIPLPESLLVAFRELSIAQRQPLISSLSSRLRSPVQQLHLIRLLGEGGDAAALHEAKKIAAEIFSAESRPWFQAFIALLLMVRRKLNVIGSPLRGNPKLSLFVNWYHASRVYSILAGASVDLGALGRQFHATASAWSADMFDRVPGHWEDIAHPRHVTRANLVLNGFQATVARLPDSARRELEAVPEFATLASPSHPQRNEFAVGYITDWAFYSNALGTFLGAPCAVPADWNDDIKAVVSGDRTQNLALAASYLNAVTDGDTSKVAWARLVGLFSDAPLPPEMHESFRALAAAVDLESLVQRDERMATLAIRFVCRHAGSLGDEAFIERLVAQVLQIARHRGESDGKSEIGTNLIDALLMLSVRPSDGPGTAQRFFNHTQSLLKLWPAQAADLADTIGVWSLTVPVEQQGAMWRFILLVRALG